MTLFYFQQGLTDQCQIQVRLILKQNSLGNTPLILVIPGLITANNTLFLDCLVFLSLVEAI